ncbi:hypothetical protein [endosymbiont GvMRE of Glomus versiforme]|uniref:hypothetical protein n=1 Tax=endosymbiont GvMRE of Glomus versiforme TaxID=2039283 RepID=UPI0015594F80|nr:hypothetical protein [endosymbiont GvMRE of Glomus versiforme]
MFSPLLIAPPPGDFSEYSPKLWLVVYEAPWKNVGNGLYAKQLDNKNCRNLD